MNVSEFIEHLLSLDIRLSVEEDKLRVNAPKGALTAELRDQIVPRKGEIIAYLKANGSKPRLENGKKIVPVSRQQPLPLSYSQLRLWFLDQLEPGSVAYTIPTVLKFEGTLDVPAMQKSINEIIRRHESLRTTFRKGPDNQPLQVIHPFQPVKLPVQDLSALPEAQREQAALQYVEGLSAAAFDLANGPLIRANLMCLDDTSHWLFVNMHHIISDGWSTGVFFGEVAALYRAFVAGQPSPLAELPVQFADYVVWQRQALNAEMVQTQLAYWQKKLQGKLPVLELPGDYPRPKNQTLRGARHELLVPQALMDRVKRTASRQAVTQFVLLEAAFDVLLQRYSGLDDIIVGTANANRQQQELEQMVGFFMNTLPLRFDLSGDPRFSDLLKQVREVSLEAFANQAVPFENLVEALRPARDTSHSAIFQVMFILQNMPFGDSNLPGLRTSMLPLDNRTAKYDLSLYIWEDPKAGPTCSFEYNIDLFTPETIARLAQNYLTLLESVCANPDERISRLGLLTEAERQTLLATWNATHTDYPRSQCLPDLFSTKAQQAPEKVAVRDEQGQITYAGLDARANQLAHYLQAQGVGPEALVGVCLPRAIDLIVALLGIQKAGGAYLPLDPHFPADRLAYMLEDSQAKVLLTHSDLAAQFSNAQAGLICLDTEAETIAGQPSTPVSSGLQPNNLAYVLYTSGSTGRPKGVQVLQRGLVNFLTSMQARPGLSAEDILLSVTTLSFDISGLELYLPLVSGAQLALVSSATAVDGQKLKQALDETGATVMQATPATWRLLLAAGWDGNPTFKILCGGEALPADLVPDLLARSGSFWNMYGPTETTIWSTCEQITAANQTISIGRPVANTRIYILDKHGLPTPVGVPGELFIAGDGVARGYWNRPDLTAERFLADPFGQEEDARMYRTGDLARYLSDGRIDFLGRIDNQVKLRGFRIELGEIEAVLTQHQGIRQAVAVVREDTPGDKRLVAYLTVHSLEPSVSEMRVHLHEKLPEYMIPSLFVFLDELPLTPNGKIDRRALPAPETSRPDLITSYVAPQNETERTIAAIWQETLKVEQVGIDDNFFELGGHSLLIVQIHQLLKEKFAMDLTIAQMFQYPTVRTLAQYLDRSPSEGLKINQAAIDRATLQREAIAKQRGLNRPLEGDLK